MIAAVLVPIVLVIIFLLRTKLGDATYDQIVIAGFKWLFILTGAAFVCLYIYSHYLR